MLFIKLRKLQPRSRHDVAHRAAHRWEPCEICGVVEMLSSENVLDDEVVGEVGEGLAPVSRGSIAALALLLACASFHTERRVGRHRRGCRVRVVVVVRRASFRTKKRNKIYYALHAPPEIGRKPAIKKCKIYTFRSI